MKTKRRSVFLLAALALAIAACQTPSDDPDDALRALLVSNTWESDLVNYPAETPGKLMVFHSNGTGTINGGIAAQWKIHNAKLTLTTADTSDVTPKGTFAVTVNSLILTYDGRLYHMVPLGNG